MRWAIVQCPNPEPTALQPHGRLTLARRQPEKLTYSEQFERWHANLSPGGKMLYTCVGRSCCLATLASRANAWAPL